MNKRLPKSLLKEIVSSLFALFLIVGCNSNESIIESEKVIHRLVLKNVTEKYYKSKYDAFVSENVVLLFEEVMNELTSFGEITKSRKELTSFVDSLESNYKPNRFNENFNKQIRLHFELNKKLKNKQLTKIEEYDAIDQIIDFILYEASDVLTGKQPEIKLYFNDTIFLARNQIYKFPIAVYRQYYGKGKTMSELRNDLNFEEKFITINTNNIDTNVFKKIVSFELFNQFDEIQRYRESIIIKIVD